MSSTINLKDGEAQGRGQILYHMYEEMTGARKLKGQYFM
jgi:hypothetical protein